MSPLATRAALAVSCFAFTAGAQAVDRIVYPALRNDGRVTITTRDDGTFGNENGRGRGGERRRIAIRSGGDGLDAHADLRVIVPKGATVVVHSGVGEASIDNVDGRVSVSVAASRVRASHVAGALWLETGSGGVEVTDVTGDLTLDTGSGGVTLRMPAAVNASVDLETGSGGIDTDFEVKVQRMERGALRGVIGSGGGRIHIESGSGTIRLLKLR
jgi:lia operon protein LiaG